MSPSQAHGSLGTFDFSTDAGSQLCYLYLTLGQDMPSATSPISIAAVGPDGVLAQHSLRRACSRSLLLVGVLVLLVVLQCFIPLRTAIKIGADEDWELSKATLSLHGYHFYTDVWNYQPLLHTWIVTKVLIHVSPSVLGPRLVTSAFALLLLAAVFWIGLRLDGTLVGTVAPFSSWHHQDFWN
jgi:hypothetical protein